MTITEVANLHGVKQYIPSAGHTITDIIRILYNSEEDLYYQILTTLNHRTDWLNLSPDVPIYYLAIPHIKKL